MNQRETKFRAWHKKDKVMGEVIAIKWDGKDIVNIQMINPYGIDGFKSCIRSEVELIEFTGLKDKNGKEIYEGDIVRINDGYMDSYNKEVKMERGEWNPTQMFIIGTIIEIIGSIYENPELLK